MKETDKFTRDLMRIHLDEQKMRVAKQKMHSNFSSKTTDTLRKTLNLDEICDIIDRIETKTE